MSRIMLDLDGTVYQWERTARYLLRRWYTENEMEIPEGLYEMSPHYDHIEDVCGAWAIEWLFTEGVERGLFRDGHIHTGAGEAIQELSEMGKIVVITKRPEAAVNDTMEWLAFRRWKISEFHMLTASDARKSDIKPECDVYLEDSAHILEDLVLNTSGHVIVMDRPWNQDAPAHYRAYSWDDVVDHVAKHLEAL